MQNNFHFQNFMGQYFGNKQPVGNPSVKQYLGRNQIQLGKVNAVNILKKLQLLKYG